MPVNSGWVTTALMVGTLTGCKIDVPTAPPVSRDQLLASVTAEVATRIDANGHFMFPPPRIGEVPPISEARARELAAAYWRTFGWSLRPARESQRGAGIAHNLSVCPRVFFAESGYEPMPSGLPQEYRRTFGDVWIVGLCSGSEQQLAIAVSVEASNLMIDADGRVPLARAGDFASAAVPPGMILPELPEVGAVWIARDIGELVSGVPSLRRLGEWFSAFTVAWVYPIARPTVVMGTVSGVRRETGTLGFGGRFVGVPDRGVLDGNPNANIATREEPLSVLLNGTVPTTFVLTRRADIPIRWERVVLDRND